jgi:hypothetical protein
VLSLSIYNGLVDGLAEQLEFIEIGLPSHVFFWNDPLDAERRK